MIWSRMRRKSSRTEDAAEEVYQIHGTGISFSSKPDDLDDKAAEELLEIIRQKDVDGLLEVHGDAFEMDPHHLPNGFFLSHGLSYWNKQLLANTINNKKNAKWRSHDSAFGYGIGHHASSYWCFKRTFAYHKDHKTNWIMVVYSLINEDGNIKADDLTLCHVFRRDNYDPRPNPFSKSAPNFFDDFDKREVDSRMLQLEDLMNNPESLKGMDLSPDAAEEVHQILDFDQTYLNSCVEELEDLMENPKAFNDFDDFNGRHSKCDSKLKANGRNGKRSDVWKQFTELKVVRPDGGPMLKLAICHGCSMAYQTGQWKSEKGSLSNHGTKTLKEHCCKYSDHHHIAGNPQGAHHQIS